jgi:nucleoside-diphosphate-sugar epimerase
LSIGSFIASIGILRFTVFTSSQAVYALGAAIREEVFDPLNHAFTQDARTEDDYAEAKRQCESVFFRQSGFPVTAVRFPIVAGVEDYTGRLRWHLERVRQEAPIYFPSLHARLSLIHSDAAAEVLRSLADAGPWVR